MKKWCVHKLRKAEGDGESGGNFAVYALDPDNHYLEFFSDMDTIENIKTVMVI